MRISGSDWRHYNPMYEVLLITASILCVCVTCPLRFLLVLGSTNYEVLFVR